MTAKTSLLLCLLSHFAIVYTSSEKQSETKILTESFDGEAINSQIWTSSTTEQEFKLREKAQEYLVAGKTYVQHWATPHDKPKTTEFRDDTVIVKNGKLSLTCRYTNATTSAIGHCGKVDTEAKFVFKYGVVEWKVKFPQAEGTRLKLSIAPAEKSTTNMEELAANIGGTHKQAIAFGYGKYPNVQFGLARFATDLSSEYHILKLVWTPQGVQWYFDERMVFHMNVTDIIPNENMHVTIENMLDLGIGVPADVSGSFPSVIQVDYVKVADLPENEGRTKYSKAEGSRKEMICALHQPEDDLRCHPAPDMSGRGH